MRLGGWRLPLQAFRRKRRVNYPGANRRANARLFDSFRGFQLEVGRREGRIVAGSSVGAFRHAE
jgi:hypothetical protein